MDNLNIQQHLDHRLPCPQAVSNGDYPFIEKVKINKHRLQVYFSSSKKLHDRFGLNSGEINKVNH